MPTALRLWGFYMANTPYRDQETRGAAGLSPIPSVPPSSPRGLATLPPTPVQGMRRIGAVALVSGDLDQ